MEYYWTQDTGLRVLDSGYWTQAMYCSERRAEISQDGRFTELSPQYSCRPGSGFLTHMSSQRWPLSAKLDREELSVAKTKSKCTT
jgi:hypothetical protein